MQQRWLHFIESLYFEVEHEKGTENISADILSIPKEDEDAPNLHIIEKMGMKTIWMYRTSPCPDFKRNEEYEPICVKDYNAILYQSVQK